MLACGRVPQLRGRPADIAAVVPPLASRAGRAVNDGEKAPVRTECHSYGGTAERAQGFTGDRVP